MQYFNKIIKESIIVVILSSLLGLISGTVLSTNEGLLYSVPILLLILPALNSLIGDFTTILISRLTTHLLIGMIPSKIQKTKKLMIDFYGLLLSIILSLVFLIVVGYGIALATEIQIVNPLIIISILILTVLFLFIILFIILFISSVYIFRKGRDPNNFLIPIVTSLVDLLAPLFLVIFIQIFI